MGEQVRKDEDMKVMLEDGAYMPERGHETDAGIDLKAMHGQRVMPHSSAVFHTGVHVELPKGTAGLLVSKSGLNVKKDIVSTGLIDEAYRGEIVVKLYNHGEDSYMVMAGDKITNLVVIPVLYEPIKIVEHLDMDTDRGTDGFGSTGR